MIVARSKAWLAKSIGRDVMIAVAIATAMKVAAFLVAAYRPFHDESGSPVSPFMLIRGGDITFYLKSVEQWFEKPLSELAGSFVQYYGGDLLNSPGYIVSGPLYPALLKITGYAEGAAFPLALLFLLVAIAVQTTWTVWLSRRLGLGLPWLICFALLPNPIWFMLRLSTDMLFAFAVVGFFVTYFRDQVERSDILWVCFLGLTVLIRPNALALVLFVAFDQAVLNRSWLRWTNGVVLILLLCASAFYLPYFIELMTRADAGRPYYFFGYAQGAYLRGIFDELPTFLDLPLSWFSLLAAKCLYFVGIRPSFADMPMHIVVVRAAVGVLLLPGLFAALILGDNRLRAFIAFYCLPIFLGPTQERYNLAIQPLLFGYGCLAVESALRQMTGKRRSGSIEYLTRLRSTKRGVRG